MQILDYASSSIAIAVVLWQPVAKAAEGHIDYSLCTIGGVTFIMLVACNVKWRLDPQLRSASRRCNPPWDSISLAS